VKQNYPASFLKKAQIKDSYLPWSKD